MTDLTQERLKELLHYDEDTGVFVWRHSSFGVNEGDIAGCENSNGYIRIKIDGQSYKSHRLAVLYCIGSWPVNQIDHIDGVRTNNSIFNLREATQTENVRNSRIFHNNTSGVKGVNWNKLKCKWQARLSTDVGRKHLGYFTTIEEADKVVRAAREKYHGEFANHGN